MLPMPLPRIFSRRYLALPSIKEVRDQDGEWGTVGQTRTIVLADRGTMRETLTSVTPGKSFGYDITPGSGPLKPLVAGAQGLWSFAPAGSGVEVSWQWVVEPTRGGRTGDAGVRPDVAGLRPSGARGDRAGTVAR